MQSILESKDGSSRVIDEYGQLRAIYGVEFAGSRYLVGRVGRAFAIAPL
jgi:hypothetical protein